MESNISATEPDWSREEFGFLEWNPGKRLLRSIRDYQKSESKKDPLSWLVKKTAIFRHRFWSIASGADIPINAKIGGGLLIPHPNGIVIHPEASIGPNCLILQQVTIGTTNVPILPKIGGHVDIGAGAKVLGPIEVGDHCLIGANAVLLQNLPSKCSAVGIPAKVLPQKAKSKELEKSRAASQ